MFARSLFYSLKSRGAGVLYLIITLLFAHQRYKAYIICIMEREFSNRPERKESDLRNQSSDELLMHVLNPYVPTATLEEIAIIASERYGLLKGEFAVANNKLIDTLAVKIKERMTERNDIAKIERRVRFHAQDEKLTESIFDGTYPPTENALKHLIAGLNLKNNDTK